MSTFILEVGSEELPSRFLPVEQRFLKERFEATLREAHLQFGEVCVYVTPRRACVEITELASVQEEREETVQGPPKRIAFDADGNPTKALEGFLRTQSLSLQDLYEEETSKGVYLAAKRRVGGAAATDILAACIPDILHGIPFAKQMRWGSHSLAYARPVHWIVALFDTDVVPFSFGPVESGRQTYGHRIHGPGPFTIPSAADYFGILETSCRVTLDGTKRQSLIREEGERLAKAVHGSILWKDSLLTEVEGLCEHPVPLLGSFDPAYLDVPKEVLLTSMESHQKSFGVADENGALLPYFLTVLNIAPQDLDLVRKGWERVLHARLEDARFFWKEDLQSSFDSWLSKLDAVIFIGPLGSMGEKTKRLEALSAWLCDTLGLEGRDGLSKADFARSGRLSKADLVSGMVGEFDTLQGVMGGIYAEKMGEKPLVAKALREQYLPQGPDSPLPESFSGAVLAIADKADTLAGCFGLNKIPSGTADPFALRRCALGIIRIAEAFSFSCPISGVMERAFELYGDRPWKNGREKVIPLLLDFFRGRLENHLVSKGHGVVVTQAVLAAGFDNIPDTVARVEALSHFAEGAEYVPSVQVLKRIANIMQKERGTETSVTGTLFEDPSEKALFDAVEGLSSLRSSQDYASVLASLSTLRPVVDTFFENVMVLCEDKKVRANRLALLRSIHTLYSRVADFSALQI
ncbi:MAG: glycine--tRNA ligase subunit beta [Desulfovibrio sp.]|nr:glycine--tRNA ligase subunit beta [Desulfovibrio sp.]